MATKKKITVKKTAKPAKKASKTPQNAPAKIIPAVILDHPDDDFSTNSSKFAFSHSAPEDNEPEQTLLVPEQSEEELVVEEIIEISVDNDVSTDNVHFVVATPNTEPAKNPEPTENFTDYGISLELSKSIAEKFGIHHKQIDIILSESSDEIEISFARIYLSGEDVARLSIGSW